MLQAKPEPDLLNHEISEIAGKSGSTEIFDSKSDRNWKTRAGMCDVNASEIALVKSSGWTIR